MPTVSALAPMVAAGAAAGSVAASTFGQFAGRMIDVLKRSSGADERSEGPSAASMTPALPASTDAAALLARLRGLLSDVRTQVTESLAPLGMAPAPNLAVGLDELGDVRVRGDVAGRSEIETQLQSAPGLAELLAAIGRTVNQLDALGAAESGDGRSPIRPATGDSLGMSNGTAPRTPTVVFGHDAAYVTR